MTLWVGLRFWSRFKFLEVYASWGKWLGMEEVLETRIPVKIKAQQGSSFGKRGECGEWLQVLQ